MEKKDKKENFLIRFFKAIGRGICWFFCAIIFAIVFVFFKIFFRCKVKGKEKIRKDDEARVFISNHYEMYGPLSMFLRFPMKKRLWIIDKMMSTKDIEYQIGLMIYNNYKSVPRWIKKIVISCIKYLVVFTMKYGARGIAVSRENPRQIVQTMKISEKVLNRGQALIIFPEHRYMKEGVGEFEKGFEHIAKYYYQKSGKKITFYPVFISEVNREMYIEEPITFDPENEQNAEKERITSYLYESLINSYKTNEVGSKKYVAHKQKLAKKEKKVE